MLHLYERLSHPWQVWASVSVKRNPMVVFRPILRVPIHLERKIGPRLRKICVWVIGRMWLMNMQVWAHVSMWPREEWLASFMSRNYCLHPSIRSRMVRICSPLDRLSILVSQSIENGRPSRTSYAACSTTCTWRSTSNPLKIKGYVPAKAKGPSSLSVRTCERYFNGWIQRQPALPPYSSRHRYDLWTFIQYWLYLV